MRFPRDPWEFVRPHVNKQRVLELGALPAVPRERALAGAGGRDGAAWVPNLGADIVRYVSGFEGTYLPIWSARR